MGPTPNHAPRLVILQKLIAIQGLEIQTISYLTIYFISLYE